MYQQLRKYTYVIANVPYSRVDYYYSTTDDLLKVFEVLDEYCQLTNEDLENYYDSRNIIKDILLIVDEAHLYLGARESLTKASILNKLKLIFTQCRKRKIRIVFITQRLTQIDIYVRRLSDYVEEYNMRNIFGLELDKKSVYLNKGDVVDIETDQSVKFNNAGEMQTIKEETLIHSEYFSPLTSFLEVFALFDKGYRDIIKEEHMTYHVCGSPDPRVRELTFPILMRELIIQPDENDIKRLKKIRENKGKKWYEIYLPTLTKLVKYYYNLLKQKIIPIFHPGYESLDFNELYSEIDREEKINSVLHEKRENYLQNIKDSYKNYCYVSDDLLEFIRKQDDLCNSYKSINKDNKAINMEGINMGFNMEIKNEENLKSIQNIKKVSENKVLILY